MLFYFVDQLYRYRICVTFVVALLSVLSEACSCSENLI